MILVAVLGFVSGCVTAPPFQEMSDARQAIAAAEEAGANEFSPKLLSYAHDHMNNAKQYISSHNYRLARSNALMAHKRAVEALNKIRLDNP